MGGRERRIDWGRGGMHLFYKAPEMAHVGSGKWLQGVEHKAGSNGYVILPPGSTSAVAIAGETGY